MCLRWREIRSGSWKQALSELPITNMAQCALFLDHLIVIAMNDFDKALSDFLIAIDKDTHQFASTLAFINQWFDFTPSAFRNGKVNNTAEQNQGSCRALAMASMLGLTGEQALKCFGEHYRDVVATPGVDNHHNLRRLQAEGLVNIQFDHPPLRRK